MSKCWYCNNELATGDNPKHFGICNKCYDEMFKSGDTIIRSFTNKIADLEAKLTEKNKEIEKLNACVDFYKSYYISFKGKVIDELEKVKSVINTSVRDDHIIWDFDIKAHIDNQINVLRNNKDGIH